MAEIAYIRPDSPAEKAGLKSGDKIISINNEKLRDYIDYLFLALNEELNIKYLDSKDDKIKSVKIKLINEDAGIRFSDIVFDGLKKCKNKCIFCFVDQQPSGSRETLIKKDDDYRFSFLQGSFITLTNLNDYEFERIKQEKLSPLYISVHATEPELRKKLMCNPRAGKIIKDLKELAEAGIHFHLQLVLIPGINDGIHLEKSLKDLIKLGEAVESIGIVPVGLTGHRDNLPDLDSYNKDSALEVIEITNKWQNKLLNKKDYNHIYLSDEFYLLANKKIPDRDHYNEFSQLENGIGMTRLELDRYNEVKDNYVGKEITINKNLTIVTSELGWMALENFWKDISSLSEKINIKIIENKYLGGGVTVTGLLAAEDIIYGLSDEKNNGILILPDIIFNDDGLTLDDYNIYDLNKILNYDKICKAEDLEDILEVIYHGKTDCCYSWKS
ncbi:MAG: DUF512 domain-containing protein [Bacillota bacterium]